MDPNNKNNMQDPTDPKQRKQKKPATSPSKENIATNLNNRNLDNLSSKFDQLEENRRKIDIQFLNDKNKRSVTFSKRKKGIMKKAYELSVLTGSEILLMVASETGHVYTFATPKLRPLVSAQESFIQNCLNDNNQENKFNDNFNEKEVDEDENFEDNEKFENNEGVFR